MRRIIQIAICFFLFNQCFGQISFQKRFGWIGDDEGRSVQQTFDGGYIVTGKIDVGVSWYDAFLLKTDSLGDTLWVKTFDNGHGNEQGFAVCQTADSGYIITGFTGFTPDFSVYAIRTDKYGDTLWTRGYALTELAHAVCETIDKGFVIAGRCSYITAGQEDIFVMRIDSTGDTLWAKAFGGSAYEEADGICATPDSGFLILGETESFSAGDNDLCLIKIDANGNIIWTKVFGDSLHNTPTSIQVTSDGNYIISASSINMSNSSNHLIKIDTSGSIIWMKTFSDSVSSLNFDATQLSDDGYLITGSIGRSLLMVKTDNYGDTLWTKSIGQTYSKWGHCVRPTRDNGFIITGGISTFDSLSYDVFLVKVDSNQLAGCGSNPLVVTKGNSAFSVRTSNIISTNVPVAYFNGASINNHRGVYCSDVCATVNIDKVEEISPMIYPNPAADNLIIDFGKTVFAEISIWDLTGRLNSHFTMNDARHFLDVKDLRNGLYFLRIETSGSIYNKTVIIE